MIVRTAQLRSLNEDFALRGNTLVLLYGRDGCEKEALLRVYLQDKKHFYYRARHASAMEQYRHMSAEAERAFDVKLRKGTYEEIFERVKSGSADKLAIVVDEFQYIAKKDPSFIEAVAKLMQKRLYPGPVQLILASGDVAWAEHDMADCLAGIAEKSRLTIKLEDLSFLDLVRAYPGLPIGEVVRIYGVIGGVSAYVGRWNQKAGFKENICRNVLSPHGYLYGKAEQYISLRLRELSVYDTILAAIAAGRRKLNDIYQLTGFSRAKISVYLKNLMEIDVIEKAESFETGGWRNAQKGLYQISDNYVNFWFRFVYPHLSDLYMLRPDEYYDLYIAPYIEEYMGRYFVKVCMEYIRLLDRAGKLPIHAAKAGTWIGKEGTVDIVAMDEERNTIVGACNWSRPAMTDKDLVQLSQALKKARLAPKHIFLFTATEFAPQIIELARQDSRFIPVDMKEL